MTSHEQRTSRDLVDRAPIDYWTQSDGRWRWRWKSGDAGTALVSNFAYDSRDEAVESARACFPEMAPSDSRTAAGIEHPGIAGTAVLGAVLAGALRRWRQR